MRAWAAFCDRNFGGIAKKTNRFFSKAASEGTGVSENARAKPAHDQIFCEKNAKKVLFSPFLWDICYFFINFAPDYEQNSRRNSA